MNAELTAFTESLENCGIDKLRETCISIFQEKQALSRRMKEVENATTEMALQFQQMKMERDAALHENEELKKQNVHLTQVLALRQQEMFGKSSEKASELQSSANEEHSDPLSEDAEAEQDGSQEEDNGNPGGRGGGYGGGRKDRKPKTTRKEAFAGLPRQNVYELDVDELNRISCMIEVRRFHDLLCAGLRPGMISVISDISLIRTFWLFRHCHFQSSLINERLHNG